MKITGKCHCGNLSYRLDWPGADTVISVRACGCTFCVKHGGVWTSHADGRLLARVRDQSLLSKYRFGTATAEFYVCKDCGGVPFVISEIDGQPYAVVNINTFEHSQRYKLVRTASSFDGESVNSRLERRRKNWIPSVEIAT